MKVGDKFRVAEAFNGPIGHGDQGAEWIVTEDNLEASIRLAQGGLIVEVEPFRPVPQVEGDKKPDAGASVQPTGAKRTGAGSPKVPGKPKAVPLV